MTSAGVPVLHILTIKAIVGNGSRLTAFCTCGWTNWSPKTGSEAKALHAEHVAKVTATP